VHQRSFATIFINFVSPEDLGLSAAARELGLSGWNGFVEILQIAWVAGEKHLKKVRDSA
jgi:hypothetical protein